MINVLLDPISGYFYDTTTTIILGTIKKEDGINIKNDDGFFMVDKIIQV